MSPTSPRVSPYRVNCALCIEQLVCPIPRSWTSWFQITVQFTEVTAPFYPNLYNFSLSIGNIRAGIKPGTMLQTRDGQFMQADTT